MKAMMVFSFFVFTTLQVCAQFIVDAGNDAKTCSYLDTVKLGGHPSASGGTAPYVFQWKCRFYHQYPSYPVQLILNDPASPNPIIKNYAGDFNDTIEFYLTVTDSDQNILKDSVNVIVSTFSILTMENGVTINIGDSAQISPENVCGGISPYLYLWSPSAGLSDPYIEKPWAKPPVSTSYSVKVTDAIGCTANDLCWVEVRTTGIDPGYIDKGSSIYPEPINYKSVIHFNDPGSTDLKIKVFSQNGRQVLSDRYYQNYPVGEKISSPGIYLYFVYRNNHLVSSGKIIKQ